MNWELYAAFCIASALLIIMPGPIVTLVIANSLRRGTGFGLATMLGGNLGTGIMLTAGAVGMTTVLTLVSDLFDVVRYLGAAYLIYLGIREWRSRAVTFDEMDAESAEYSKKSKQSAFWTGVMTGITNPKTIIFYAAFFPQFVDPGLAAGPQLAVMTVSFLCIALVLDGSYAVLAGRVRPLLQDGRKAIMRARVTGSLLIFTGIGLALMRRESA
ncbi:MAG: LysE family translocator [Alphaproteobacteria bacterium]